MSVADMTFVVDSDSDVNTCVETPFWYVEDSHALKAFEKVKLIKNLLKIKLLSWFSVKV